MKILGRPESGVLVVEEGRELSLICQVRHNFVKNKFDKKIARGIYFCIYFIIKKCSASQALFRLFLDIA